MATRKTTRTNSTRTKARKATSARMAKKTSARAATKKAATKRPPAKRASGKKAVRKTAAKKTAARQPAAKKVVTKQGAVKQALLKKAVPKRTRKASTSTRPTRTTLAKKAATRKKPLVRSEGGKRERALYGKEVETLKHLKDAPVPDDDGRAAVAELPMPTFDPTPDTYVHPRGHTGADRYQSERTAALTQLRARSSRKSISNTTGRKGMGRKGRVG